MAAGATFEPIATQTLASTSTLITFSSISSSYTDLQVVVLCQGSAASALNVLLNNDNTAGNYSWLKMIGNGTAAQSENNNSRGALQFGIDSGLPTSSTFALCVFDVFSYASTDKFKSVIGRWSSDGYTETTTELYKSTSAVNRVDLRIGGGSASFSIGTTVTLYGIKAA
jgi:hypothetical protein